MYYGFRLNDAKEWTKIKEFKTIEEFKEYTERKNIVWAKLIDEQTYKKYYLNHSSTEPDDDDK